MTDTVEKLLQSMVGFDTVNANISGKADAEMALAEYLETQAKAFGLQTQRLAIAGQSFNLLVSHQISDEAPWLLFESHLDTVTVEGMTVDPFAAEIKDGRLYGRGSCDTKGTGAAMLWALKQYREWGSGGSQGSGGGNNVAIVYTIDEEIGKTGVRTFVGQQLATLGWRPAGAVVGEPTQLKPVIAHNGVVRWRIRTEGVAAHSMDPSRGKSAIAAMVKVIDALESGYIAKLVTSHPLTGKAQCSINIIQGGVQINIIPEQCEIHLDRRVVPGERPDDVIPAVEQVLAELRQREPELVVSQLEPDNSDWPLDPAGGESMATFVKAVVDQMGLPSELTGVGYGTDGSNLSRAGIPTVVLGPGNIAQAHTHNEWLDLEQLHQGVELYQQLMSTPLTIN